MSDEVYKNQIVYLNEQLIKQADKLQRIKALANDVELAYQNALKSDDDIFREFIRGAFVPTMEYIRQVNEIIRE